MARRCPLRAYALYDGQGNTVQGLSPNISMPGAATSKPWQINVSCQQTPKLLYGSKADGQRIRIKRGANGNGTEKLRVNITTDVRGARFLQLQNITTNDPGPTSGDDEPAGTLRLDYGNGIRTKAWGIEEGGGMVNWNFLLDPMPCCVSYHHAQFKQQWEWRIGESSMGNDSSWDASSIEWYAHGNLGSSRYFNAIESGILENGSVPLHLDRFMPESMNRVWTYQRTGSAPSPQMRLVVKTYMPGGVDMESEQ